MATGDSARFGQALSGEATRGTAAGGAPAGRARLGLADISTDLQAPASEPPPPPGELPPVDPEVGPEDDDEGAVPPAATPGADAFAEFEAQAIAAESTRIDESDLLAEQSTAILDEGPAMPFLFVEAGKDRGREYVLQEGETSIGRGIDNDVILADVSVSRKHVRVIREGGTITLRDLGSGNGSLVNGRKAHLQQLAEGDRIEIGETVLVLRVPGGATDEPLPGATDSGSGATAETAIPSGDVAAPAMPYVTPAAFAQPTYPPSSTDSLPLPSRDGPTRSVVLPRRLAFISAAAVAVLASMIGAGVATYLGRDEPVASPLPVGATSPAIVPTAPPQPVGGGPGGVAAAGLPLPVVGGAGTTGAGIAPGVPAAPVPAPVAVGAAVPILPAPTPGVVDTAAPIPAPAPATPTPTAEDDAVERASGDDGPTRRSGGRGDSAPARTGGREAALSAYRSANFSEAARLARDAASHASSRDRRALEQLANDIESFGELYPRIRDVGERYSTIERIAGPALRLDRSISGGHFTNDLRTRYVAWLVAQGESGLSADPVAACGRAMSASGLDSSNARVRALMGRCETRAGDMLAEATRVERSDSARATTLYRNISRMLPSSHATARDAARRLAGMGRARPLDEDE